MGVNQLSFFFGASLAEESFVHFSISHLVVLLLSAVCMMMLFMGKNRGVNSSVLGYSILVLLLSSEIMLNIWYLTNGMFSLQSTLPFELCSISLYLCSIMLLTGNKSLYEVTLFWGLGGATQAMLTPVLDFSFPHFRFFQFFLSHIGIIMACLYMTWYRGYRPTWLSVWKAFFWLNILAFCNYWINRWTGANYMFVSHKPHTPSILDFLGPYPAYIIWLEIIALVAFNLIYLPFALRDRKRAVEQARSIY